MLLTRLLMACRAAWEAASALGLGMRGAAASVALRARAAGLFSLDALLLRMPGTTVPAPAACGCSLLAAGGASKLAALPNGAFWAGCGEPRMLSVTLVRRGLLGRRRREDEGVLANKRTTGMSGDCASAVALELGLPPGPGCCWGEPAALAALMGLLLLLLCIFDELLGCGLPKIGADDAAC
jgi:hypothetical protein